MATYAITFISAEGGVAPGNYAGNLKCARGLIRLWCGGDRTWARFDRICLLQVPSPSERKRSTFRGQAFVFNREEALRWANN